MIILKKYIREFIFERRISDEQSFMIALYPDEKSIDRINKFKKKFGIDKYRELNDSEIHLTLRWWNPSKIEKLDHNDCFDNVIDKLNKFSLDLPIQCKAIKYKNLGDSLSLMINNSDQIHNAYNRINKLVVSSGCPEDKYENFLPHIALYYGVSDEDKIEEEQIEVNILLNNLKLVDKDDKVYFSI